MSTSSSPKPNTSTPNTSPQQPKQKKQSKHHLSQSRIATYLQTPQEQENRNATLASRTESESVAVAEAERRMAALLGEIMEGSGL